LVWSQEPRQAIRPAVQTTLNVHVSIIALPSRIS
jgi:hypothetical protein